MIRRRRERRRWVFVAVLAAACAVTIAVLAVHGDPEPARAGAPTAIVASAAESHGSTAAASPSAHDPSADESPDATYLDLLTRADVSYDSHDEIISTGHTVCSFLRQGGTATGVRLLVTRQYPPAEGEAIATAARSAYCPEYRSGR